MTRIRSFALRNAVAFAALFVALGGTAVAAGLIDGQTIKRGSVTSTQIRNHSLLPKDFRSGRIPAGRAGARGAKGIQGKPGINGTGAGATGAKGDTGAAGINGAVGAPGAFLVKGANGATGGPLLVYGTGGASTFYFGGRFFAADNGTGALQVGKQVFYYESTDCTGPPLMFPSSRPQFPFGGPADADTGVYETTGAPQTTAVQSDRFPGGFGGPSSCSAITMSTPLVAVRALTADELPATLTGPLRFVPAN